MFSGVGAEGRAAAAVVLLDIAAHHAVTGVELLANTRAPTGEVWTDTGAGLAWAVACAEGGELSEAEEEEVEGWLAANGLTRGQRASHDLCPIDPCHVSGDDPVIALDSGVWCHRCHGVNGVGFVGYAQLLGVRDPEPLPVLEAARNAAHWGHVSIVLRSSWSSKVPWWVARVAYEALVEEDSREAVFQSDWVWFRSESGAWINPRSGNGEGVRKALASLSWSKGVAARMVLAENPGPLPGVTPVRPCGVCLRPDAVPEGVVSWQRRPDVDPWREDVLGWDVAFGRLCDDFPGCSEVYLQSCLVLMVCAEAGDGQYQLLVTGTSGTAKSTIPRIAAGIVGSDPATLRIDVGVEEWRRQVGQALESGQRPMILNEVDKVRGVRSHIGKLLDLSDPHQWRPLYGSDIQSPWRAPLICTAVTAPEIFGESEMGRRFRHIDLLSRVPSWYGRKLEGWRRMVDPGERSLGTKPGRGWRVLCADSLLAWALGFAADHGYRWDDCADALGVPHSDRADDGEADVSDEAYKGLWDYCCGQGRVVSTSQRWRACHGWVDLTSDRARAVLDPLRPDVADGVSESYVLGRILASVDWTGILGVACKFEARSRGHEFVGRFRAPGSGDEGSMRQNWVSNEHIVRV